MMYELGQRSACATLGLLSREKTAGPVGRALMRVAKRLGPRAASGALGTGPFLAPLGALTGGVTGALASDEGERGRGALRGILFGGALGGLGAGIHGGLRKHLSKIPTSIPHPKFGHRGTTILNPKAHKEFNRIFREAAGVAGLGGVGGGLLAAKHKEASFRFPMRPGLSDQLIGRALLGLPSAAIGGVTGAVGSDEGERGRGALQGAVLGELLGALGAEGGSHVGRFLSPRTSRLGPQIGLGAGALTGGIGGGLLGRSHPSED